MNDTHPALGDQPGGGGARLGQPGAKQPDVDPLLVAHAEPPRRGGGWVEAGNKLASEENALSV